MHHPQLAYTPRRWTPHSRASAACRPWNTEATTVRWCPGSSRPCVRLGAASASVKVGALGTSRQSVAMPSRWRQIEASMWMAMASRRSELDDSQRASAEAERGRWRGMVGCSRWSRSRGGRFEDAKLLVILSVAAKVDCRQSKRSRSHSPRVLLLFCLRLRWCRAARGEESRSEEVVPMLVPRSRNSRGCRGWTALTRPRQCTDRPRRCTHGGGGVRGGGHDCCNCR